ncbi:hypothetical protein BH11BAC2_BH11BAC2_18120 [soil metagenome]
MSTQKELILQEIEHLLETIQEQYADARLHSGAIPLIEMDLMKQSVRNLYQQLHYLGQRKNSEIELPEVSAPTPEVAFINSPLKIEEESSRPAPIPMQETEKTPTPLIQQVEAVVTFETEITPLISIQSEPEQIAEVISYEKEEEELIEIEPIIASLETVEEIDTEIIIAESLPAPDMTYRTTVLNPPAAAPKTTVAEVKKQSAVMASLFDEPAPTVASKYNQQDTIYDKLAKGKNDESIAAKHQQQPLTDLRKSIGINERFSFINELFNGNQKSYYEAIDRINSLQNYVEARTLIHGELAVQLNWNPASSSFVKLDEMVKRRFSN